MSPEKNQIRANNILEEQKMAEINQNNLKLDEQKVVSDVKDNFRAPIC